MIRAPSLSNSTRCNIGLAFYKGNGNVPYPFKAAAQPSRDPGGIGNDYIGPTAGACIRTGFRSPAGVGLSKSKLLKIGDRVDITIEGCGTLVNTIVADGSARGQP